MPMKIWTSISWSVVKQCRNVKCYECKSELATAGLLNVLRGFCNTVYDLSPLICTVWVLFLPLVISLYCNKGLRFRPQNRLLFVCGHQGHFLTHFLCFLFAIACLFRYNLLSFVYLIYLLLIPLFAEPTKTTMQGEKLILTSLETNTRLLFTPKVVCTHQN